MEDRGNIALDVLINLDRMMQTYAGAFDSFAKLTTH